MQGEEFRSFAGMGAFADEDAYKTMEWGYEKRQLGIVREMVRKSEGLRRACRSRGHANLLPSRRPHRHTPSTNTVLAVVEDSAG